VASRHPAQPVRALISRIRYNTKMNGAAFLREVVEVFPYKLHTVLTDNGMAFADLSKNRGRYQPVDKIEGFTRLTLG
jgi:hypothetical protein